MFLISFLIFIFSLAFILFSIKKKLYKFLLIIAVITCFLPFYSIYLTGVQTDWTFMGDGYWTRVILFIISDIPSFIILSIITFNYNKTLDNLNETTQAIFMKAIFVLFTIRCAFHLIEYILSY